MNLKAGFHMNSLSRFSITVIEKKINIFRSVIKSKGRSVYSETVSH